MAASCPVRQWPERGLIPTFALHIEAIIRSKTNGGLYGEHQGGIGFLSGSLFRTTVALPANVPTGNLKVLVYAFSHGQVSSFNSMTLYVEKSDIERRLSEWAHQVPVVFGFGAVLLAGLTGVFGGAGIPRAELGRAVRPEVGTSRFLVQRRHSNPMIVECF